MTQTIDIVQRAASRATDFQPGYGRRYDTDKPGKPWRRENDGPAPDRDARSAAALARLQKPKPWMVEPGQAPERPLWVSQDEIEAQHRMRSYLEAVLAGARTNSEVAKAIRKNQDNIRYFADRAVRRGYLLKKPAETVGRARVVPLEITDAGRAWLEAMR